MSKFLSRLGTEAHLFQIELTVLELRLATATQPVYIRFTRGLDKSCKTLPTLPLSSSSAATKGTVVFSFKDRPLSHNLTMYRKKPSVYASKDATLFVLQRAPNHTAADEGEDKQLARLELDCALYCSDKPSQDTEEQNTHTVTLTQVKLSRCSDKNASITLRIKTRYLGNAASAGKDHNIEMSQSQKSPQPKSPTAQSKIPKSPQVNNDDFESDDSEDDVAVPVKKPVAAAAAKKPAVKAASTVPAAKKPAAVAKAKDESEEEEDESEDEEESDEEEETAKAPVKRTASQQAKLQPTTTKPNAAAAVAAKKPTAAATVKKQQQESSDEESSEDEESGEEESDDDAAATATAAQVKQSKLVAALATGPKPSAALAAKQKAQAATATATATTAVKKPAAAADDFETDSEEETPAKPFAKSATVKPNAKPAVKAKAAAAAAEEESSEEEESESDVNDDDAADDKRKVHFGTPAAAAAATTLTAAAIKKPSSTPPMQPPAPPPPPPAAAATASQPVVSDKSNSSSLSTVPNSLIQPANAPLVIKDPIATDSQTATTNDSKMTCARMFDCTLEQAMSLNISKSNLTVPQLFDELLQHFTRLKSEKQEGIFRQSPKLTELSVVKDALLNVTSTTEYNKLLQKQCKDPYCCASLIKQWCASLREPVVPRSVNAHVLRIGLIEDDVESDDDTASSKKPTVEQQLSECLGQFPKYNLAVLQRLSVLFATILTPTAQKLNRMQLHALSVVFAPNLVRLDSPTTDASADSSTTTTTTNYEAFQNAKYSVRFVELVFKHSSLLQKAITVSGSPQAKAAVASPAAVASAPAAVAPSGSNPFAGLEHFNSSLPASPKTQLDSAPTSSATAKPFGVVAVLPAAAPVAASAKKPTTAALRKQQQESSDEEEEESSEEETPAPKAGATAVKKPTAAATTKPASAKKKITNESFEEDESDDQITPRTTAAALKATQVKTAPAAVKPAAATTAAAAKKKPAVEESSDESEEESSDEEVKPKSTQPAAQIKAATAAATPTAKPASASAAVKKPAPPAESEDEESSSEDETPAKPVVKAGPTATLSTPASAAPKAAAASASIDNNIVTKSIKPSPSPPAEPPSKPLMSNTIASLVVGPTSAAQAGAELNQQSEQRATIARLESQVVQSQRDAKESESMLAIVNQQLKEQSRESEIAQLQLQKRCDKMQDDLKHSVAELQDQKTKYTKLEQQYLELIGKQKQNRSSDEQIAALQQTHKSQLDTMQRQHTNEITKQQAAFVELQQKSEEKLKFLTARLDTVNAQLKTQEQQRCKEFESERASLQARHATEVAAAVASASAAATAAAAAAASKQQTATVNKSVESDSEPQDEDESDDDDSLEDSDRLAAYAKRIRRKDKQIKLLKKQCKSSSAAASLSSSLASPVKASGDAATAVNADNKLQLELTKRQSEITDLKAQLVDATQRINQQLQHSVALQRSTSLSSTASSDSTSNNNNAAATAALQQQLMQLQNESNQRLSAERNLTQAMTQQCALLQQEIDALRARLVQLAPLQLAPDELDPKSKKNKKSQERLTLLQAYDAMVARCEALTSSLQASDDTLVASRDGFRATIQLLQSEVTRLEQINAAQREAQQQSLSASGNGTSSALQLEAALLRATQAEAALTAAQQRLESIDFDSQRLVAFERQNRELRDELGASSVAIKTLAQDHFETKEYMRLAQRQGKLTSPSAGVTSPPAKP